MVSEKDLQSYLKVAASALPCREARKSVASISPVMVTYCCKYYYSIYTYRSGTSLCWAIDV